MVSGCTGMLRERESDSEVLTVAKCACTMCTARLGGGYGGKGHALFHLCEWLQKQQNEVVVGTHT